MSAPEPRDPFGAPPVPPAGAPTNATPTNATLPYGTPPYGAPPYGSPAAGPSGPSGRFGPAGAGPAPVPPYLAGHPGPDADRPTRRTPWLALAGTATAAALVASLATAGLTGAFTADEPTTSAPSPAAVEQQESTVPVAGSTAEQPDWQAVAAAVRPSVVAVDVRTGAGSGTGSGVVIDRKGNILTNDHVVGDAVEGGLQVTLADGRVFEATLVGTDPTTDLAVIRLVDPPDDLSPAVLGDSDTVAVGAPVMAVGNPLGLDSTATTGIVSAVDRPVSTSGGGQEAVVTNAIQIDAAINPGNSGGPLFNASGEVIGITSSIASLSASSGSIGLGFAIPVNLADRVAGELVADGSADHAFLGVAMRDGTASVDGTTRRGAVVEQVTDGSPAADAGIEVGDVIVAIGQDPVNGAEALTAFVRERAAGSVAMLTVVRDGTALDAEVTFAVRAEGASR